jgi:hypothetical protein
VDRIRYPLTFLAIVFVAVLGAMGSARGAAAQEVPAAASAAPAAPEFDFDEEELLDADLGEEAEGEGEEADECEFDDEAREEACEEELEEREMEELEAEECRLEAAEATVAAVPGRNQVRLTVRYKTFEASTVAIDLDLRGGKGSLDLGSDTARLGRSGTLHTTETLTDPQMTRALAAREFTVGIYAINTPDSCRDDFQRHLTARRGAGAGLQWSDPSEARRAKAARTAARAKASRAKTS